VTPEAIYTDGGVIGPNPSKLGITWAWCQVRGDSLLRSGSGIIEPADLEMETCSNNVAELMGALRGLLSVPVGWDGILYTDSKVTLHRITDSFSFKGVPQGIINQVLKIRRGRKYKVVLLAGHPTRAEMKSGCAVRNGLPVSKWNVWCDKECCRLATEFKESLK
jgi:ribonuclease HI